MGIAKEVASRPELIARFEQRGEVALKWLEASCREARVPVTTDLLFGGVPELVLQATAEAELVALGRRGHGHPTDQKYLGRNLRAIAQHPQQPMLVAGDERRLIKRLLLVYDPSRRNQRALTWASLFQHMLPSTAVVLVSQEVYQASQPGLPEAEVQAYLEQTGLSDYHLVSSERSLAAGIVSAAADNDVDLIVMGEHRHTIASRWLIGPVLNHVLRNTSLPVLLA